MKDAITSNEPPRDWRGKLIWVAEMGLMFAGLLTLDTLLGPTVSLLHASPHPFWIPVLFVSLTHGPICGIAAAAAATVLGWWHGWVPLSGELDFYRRMLALWKEPILWLAAAFVAGAFQERGEARCHELAQAAGDMRVQRDVIASHADALRGHVATLEAFIASMPAENTASHGAAVPRTGIERLRALARDHLGCDMVGLWLCQNERWVRLHGDAVLTRMIPALDVRFGENTDAITLPRMAVDDTATDTPYLAVAIRTQPGAALAGIILLGEPHSDLHPRAALATAGALGPLACAIFTQEGQFGAGPAKDNSFGKANEDDRAH